MPCFMGSRPAAVSLLSDEGGKMSRLIKHTRKLYSDETGASAVEYGVIIALIIAACFATIVILGNRVEQGYQSFSDALEAQGIS